MEVREPSAKYLAQAAYKQTEVGVIPDDWRVSTVGEEFAVDLGKMLDTEKNVGEPKPFLGNRAVQWGYIDISDIGEIKLSPTELHRFRLRNGDLLVCEGGDVGRSAIWREPIDECYYQKALHRLRPKRGFNAILMQSILHLYSTTGVLQNYVTQTSIAHLPKDKFEGVPIPVPPTPEEQQAIAEALSDADALIEAQEQLLAKKRQIKQGAMQELLTGKRCLLGFAGEWGRTALGRWGRCHRGVSYNPATDLSTVDADNTVRLLRSNNVQESAVVFSDFQYVDTNRVSPDQYLQADDILICVANGSRDLVGKSARFSACDGFEYTFGAFMGCFRADARQVDPGFAFYVFQTEAYRNHIAILLVFNCNIQR